MAQLDLRTTSNQYHSRLSETAKFSQVPAKKAGPANSPKLEENKKDGDVLDAAKPQKDIGAEVGKFKGQRDDALLKDNTNLKDPVTGKSLLPERSMNSGFDTSTPGVVPGFAGMEDQLAKAGSRYQSAEQQINDLASQSRNAKGDRTSQASDGFLGAKASHITAIGIGASLGAALGGVAISGIGVAAGAAALAAGSSEKLDQADQELHAKDDKIETEITRMAAEKARKKGAERKAEKEKAEKDNNVESKDKTENKDKTEEKVKTEDKDKTDKEDNNDKKTQSEKTTPLPDGANTIDANGSEAEVKARQEEVDQGLKNPGTPDTRPMPDPDILMNADRQSPRVGWAINWGDDGPAPITGNAPTPDNGVADPPEAFGGDADPTGPSIAD